MADKTSLAQYRRIQNRDKKKLNLREQKLSQKLKKTFKEGVLRRRRKL